MTSVTIKSKYIDKLEICSVGRVFVENVKDAELVKKVPTFK